MPQEVVSAQQTQVSCIYMCMYVQFTCSWMYECVPACKNNTLYPSSAFKACHPKVKSFYFAADGVDDMNR